MAFTAECPFCHIQLRNVPHDRAGASTECPRCHSLFTLAPLLGIRPAARSKAVPSVPAAASTLPEFSWGTQTVSPSVRTPLPPTASLPAPSLKLTPRSALPLPANETDFGPPPDRGEKSLLGIGAFFLGSAALLAASIPPLGMLTLPASGVGVVLGIAGLFRRLSKRGGGVGWPAAGLAVSLSVCIVAGLWPTVLGLAPRGTGAGLPVNERLTLVPLMNRTGSAARSATEADWVDASQNAVHKSDLRLVVTSVTVKPVEYKDARGKQAATREKYLVIGLRLSNVGINHTIDYASWGETGQAGGERSPRLQDNFGRTYSLKTFEPGTEVAGRLRRATIGPLKAVQDVLIFEPPAAGIDSLRLELPCSVFGAADKFRLIIPGRWVAYQ